MAYVKVDETEPLEKAIKRFKRMVEKEGVIREFKMREYFEKPSAIQHRKNKALARKQMLKVKKTVIDRRCSKHKQLFLRTVTDNLI